MFLKTPSESPHRAEARLTVPDRRITESALSAWAGIAVAAKTAAAANNIIFTS
jgi:hypothetical protein